MAVLPVLKWPDPGLATVCAPVGLAQPPQALIADLFETMYDAPGRGLAAPQVGVLARVFVTDTTWKDGPRTPLAFVNPRVVARSETLAGADEGCLSIPGILVRVERPAWVELAWSDAEGASQQRRFDGFAAICVQHELDHLDGIVTFDRIDTSARTTALALYSAAQA